MLSSTLTSTSESTAFEVATEGDPGLVLGVGSLGDTFDVLKGLARAWERLVLRGLLSATSISSVSSTPGATILTFEAPLSDKGEMGEVGRRGFLVRGRFFLGESRSLRLGDVA